MNKSNLKSTNKLKVITKKPIKNKIRKKDKIIFHNGRSEFPFGFALSHMPKGYFGIHKAEDMFDKKGTLTGVSINLEVTVELPEDDSIDVPKNVIVIFNESQEGDEFFPMYLSESVLSTFNILENHFTLVKCRIDRSIVKIYLSKPIDIITPPAPGKCKFVKDGKEVRIIFHPGSFSKAIDRLME